MFVVVRSPYNFQCCGHFFRLLIVVLFLIGLPGIATAATGASSSSYKNTVEWQYKQASDYYYKLRNNPSLAVKREKWLTGIHELQRIYRIDPKSTRASSCLYTIARMYRTMYDRFALTTDLDKAVSFYQDVLTFFPKGNKADNALYALAQIEQEERGNFKQAVQYYDRLMRSYPTSSKKRLVKRQLEKLIEVLEKNPDYQEKTSSTPAPSFARTVSTPQPKKIEVSPAVAPPVLRKPIISTSQVESITSAENPPTSSTPSPSAHPVQSAAPIKTAEKGTVVPPEKNSVSSVPQRTVPPVLQKAQQAPEAPPVKEVKTAPRTKIVLSALKKVESTQRNKQEILAEIDRKEKAGKAAQQGAQNNNEGAERGQVDTTKKYLEKISGSADVLPVQYWSSDNYSRVVIKSSEPVAYHANLLGQQNGVPRRLFIDFTKSYIPPSIARPLLSKMGS